MKLRLSVAEECQHSTGTTRISLRTVQRRCGTWSLPATVHYSEAASLCTEHRILPEVL